MANQNGIFIVLKAWLPVEGSISEQITKLQMVEAAHASGDYADLLKAAKVEDIKTEQKTRRVEDQPQTAGQQAPETETEGETAEGETGAEGESGAEADDPVPQFLKPKRRAAATDEAA